MDPFNMFGAGKAPYEASAMMRDLARANYEIYQSHLQAGFTSDQAMQLVIELMRTAYLAAAQENNEDDNNDGGT